MRAWRRNRRIWQTQRIHARSSEQTFWHRRQMGTYIERSVCKKLTVYTRLSRVRTLKFQQCIQHCIHKKPIQHEVISIIVRFKKGKCCWGWQKSTCQYAKSMFESSTYGIRAADVVSYRILNCRAASWVARRAPDIPSRPQTNQAPISTPVQLCHSILIWAQSQRKQASQKKESMKCCNNKSFRSLFRLSTGTSYITYLSYFSRYLSIL